MITLSKSLWLFQQSRRRVYSFPADDLPAKTRQNLPGWPLFAPSDADFIAACAAFPLPALHAPIRRYQSSAAIERSRNRSTDCQRYGNDTATIRQRYGNDTNITDADKRPTELTTFVHAAVLNQKRGFSTGSRLESERPINSLPRPVPTGTYVAWPPAAMFSISSSVLA